MSGPDDARSETSARAPYLGLALTELVVLLGATLVSQMIRFGSGAGGVQLIFAGVSYTTFSVILTLLWMVILLANRLGRDRNDAFVPARSGFRDINRATAFLALAVAIYSASLQADISRGYLLVAIPLGFIALILNRVCWQVWIRKQRRLGEYCRRTVLIGTAGNVDSLRRLVERDVEAGFRVVGSIVIGDEEVGLEATSPQFRVPNAPEVEDVYRAVLAFAPEVVMTVTGINENDDFVRELSWCLEDSDIQLMVSPRVGAVSNSRIQPVPVAGHQLMNVECARFSGGKYAAKRLLDVTASLMGLIVLSPLFFVIALAICRESDGGAVFRQTRIGHRGRPFTIFKFRTMVTNAEALKASLLDQNEHGAGPLFKMRSDPRVTKVGAFLRRYSLDELPQLVNIFRGEMSLVGPRPPLASEVDTYVRSANRRLLSKPGLTGPWQVAGRSDLAWEDGLFLDLLYVENWSFFGDILILVRTAGAVFSARGAY